MRLLPLLGLALLLPLAGCGLLGRPAGTTIAPHVVFLAPTGCAAAVAKVHRGGYALMEVVEDGYAFEQGDVLEGPDREGQSIFRRFPPAFRNAEWSEGIEVPIDVVATGLELGVARRQLDARCVVEAEELPRLPGAGTVQ
ncbi:hypothetical protein [Rubricoccus marinus]|uniref:Uncharacterized protein n=1 Tax=Rubricoccus marinus TaxID=716817 RepID=A0A259U314_9BACT|nr:hypothetical protein [Rubricoccus marinus]OZC04399.1 hypothetical protein BSZ36_16280 [Rubricoccus marinus]